MSLSNNQMYPVEKNIYIFYSRKKERTMSTTTKWILIHPDRIHKRISVNRNKINERKFLIELCAGKE